MNQPLEDHNRDCRQDQEDEDHAADQGHLRGPLVGGLSQAQHLHLFHLFHLVGAVLSDHFEALHPKLVGHVTSSGEVGDVYPKIVE